MEVKSEIKEPKWPKNKTIKLIELFQMFPELWNHELKDYRDKVKKISALKTIAANLEVPETEVKRKLHNLRCQRNSEIRKLKKKSYENGGGHAKSSWEFFDALNFMVEKERNSLNTSNGSNMELTYTEIGFLDDAGRPLETFDEEPPPPPPPPPPPLTSSVIAADKKARTVNNRRQTKPADSEEERAAPLPLPSANVEQRPPSFTVFNQPKDEFVIFGDYVAAELRQLRSEDRRRRLKRMIQKAIINVCEEEDWEITNCNTNSSQDDPATTNRQTINIASCTALQEFSPDVVVMEENMPTSNITPN